MFRQTIAPKSGPPTHVHQAEDEFFYVVNGEFKVKLRDRVMSAPAQSVMFVPRGLSLFALLGDDDPLTRQYRDELASILF